MTEDLKSVVFRYPLSTFSFGEISVANLITPQDSIKLPGIFPEIFQLCNGKYSTFHYYPIISFNFHFIHFEDFFYQLCANALSRYACMHLFSLETIDVLRNTHSNRSRYLLNYIPSLHLLRLH